MTSAQTAFATLIGVFAVTGALLLIFNEPVAAWLLIAVALVAFGLLVWMIITSARAQSRRRVIEDSPNRTA